MANVIASIVSIVVTSFCGYLVWWLQKHSNNKDAEREGIKLLLRSTMKQYYNEYKDAGKISSTDYTEFEEMYKVYGIKVPDEELQVSQQTNRASE